MNTHLKKVINLITCVAFLMLSSTIFATVLSPKSDGVDVTKEASKDSAVIVKLKTGDKVEAVERSGMYWKVKTSKGEIGFVSVMKVAVAQGESSSIADAIKTAAKEGRKADDSATGRARSAVMGVRGLDQDEESSGAGNVKPNLRLIFNMEDREISKQKIKELQDSINGEIEMVMAKKGTQN
ncbi:MAG: SH3 domain-containing protein [Oligoflexales bacterium]|nr:SH3 domain-containing protein [Oligoflexales bacterium]